MRKLNSKCYIFIFRDKLYATQGRTDVENPIVDAVIKQCPNLVDRISDPTAARLSGDDIIRILCEEQCEEMKKSGKNIIIRNKQDELLYSDTNNVQFSITSYSEDFSHLNF